MGKFDVLVGINLLREGIDIPEVSFVAILDADKQGFLRSETSLIQTCGRASRNVNGRVIMYADEETLAIKHTIAITQKRRAIQKEYNEKNKIIPQTIIKNKIETIEETFGIKDDALTEAKELDIQKINNEQDIENKIKECEKEMKKAAKDLRFEDAAKLRDLLHYYQNLEIIK
jgi:excinuclease ABC subunit B